MIDCEKKKVQWRNVDLFTERLRFHQWSRFEQFWNDLSPSYFNLCKLPIKFSWNFRRDGVLQSEFIRSWNKCQKSSDNLDIAMFPCSSLMYYDPIITKWLFIFFEKLTFPIFSHKMHWSKFDVFIQESKFNQESSSEQTSKAFRTQCFWQVQVFQVILPQSKK